MAIEDALTRISSIQARFGTVLGGQALFQGVASDAARHAGLGRDETPVLDAGVASAGEASGDALLTAQGAAAGAEPGVAAIVAELQRSLGGSSTLTDLTGGDGDGGELDLLAGLLAQQQARIGLGGADSGGSSS